MYQWPQCHRVDLHRETDARIATFADSKLTREEALDLRARLYREPTDSLASRLGRGEGFRLHRAGVSEPLPR